MTTIMSWVSASFAVLMLIGTAGWIGDELRKRLAGSAQSKTSPARDGLGLADWLVGICFVATIVAGGWNALSRL